MTNHKQIRSFAIRNLLVAAHHYFHNTSSDLIGEVTPEALHLDTLYPNYKKEVEKYGSIVNKSQRLSYTSEIQKADKIRDYHLRLLFKIVKELVKNPVDNSTAYHLWSIISNYEGIWGNEISKETSLTFDLISKIRAEFDEGLLTQLGLLQQVELADMYNKEVDDLLKKRNKEESEKDATTTKEQGRLVDSLYQEIVLTVNAHAILSPTEAINQYIDQQNANVDAAKRVISSMRPGGSGNEKIRKVENSK